MSQAVLAVTTAAVLAAAGAAASLWRGAARQPWPDLRAYRWFTLAAALVCANVIVGQAAPQSAGTTAMMLSLEDLPALLLLPVMAAGLAGLASAARDRAGVGAERGWAPSGDGRRAGAGQAERGGGKNRGPDAPPARRSRRGLLGLFAYLADGYLLAAALFLIGWVTLFGAVFTRSDGGLGFGAELVHPLADLTVLWITLPVAQAVGRRAVAPYLALIAVTAGDSLAVGARVAGTRPGTGALAAQLAALALLALMPWANDVWAAGTRWLGSGREVTTTVAAATATVAGLLVVAQVIATGHLTGLVEIIILGTMAATLAVRVVSLIRRVDTWSRVWQESGRQFRQLAERTSDVVLLCDLDGVIRYASKAVAGYGYTPEALRGTPLADLLHPGDRTAGERVIRRTVTGRAQLSGQYPCRVRAEDGTWRHVESTISRYRDPGQPDLVLVTARDISAQVALRRQVTHLTFHDGLTGLPNRAYAEQRAQDVLGQAGTGRAGPALIVVDVDGFTAVNDAYGHTAGDLLLAQVARRLRQAASPEDTVARWGGDEFAVLTDDAVSVGELADIAERLARSVASHPFRLGDSDLSITASAGAALADGGPAAHVWRNAEMALARAKASGAGMVELAGAGAAVAEAGAGAGQAEPAAHSPGAA